MIFSPRLGRLITPGESTKIMSEPFIKSGLTSKLKVLWTEVSFCFEFMVFRDIFLYKFILLGRPMTGIPVVGSQTVFNGQMPGEIYFCEFYIFWSSFMSDPFVEGVL